MEKLRNFRECDLIVDVAENVKYQGLSGKLEVSKSEEIRFVPGHIREFSLDLEKLWKFRECDLIPENSSKNLNLMKSVEIR